MRDTGLLDEPPHEPIRIEPEMLVSRDHVVLKERGLEWKGYYAGRRGLATLLANTNPQAAMGMLRHATLNTTQGFYIKQIPAATIDAMNALEASLSANQETNERQPESSRS
jgi:hypothetical protein